MNDTSPTRRILGAAARSVLVCLLVGAVGCSQFVGTTALSFLRKIRESPDPNIRYLAYSKLASPRCYDDEAQKAEAVRTLIEKLEEGREPLASRAVICRTLGELGDPSARPALITVVSDSDGVVRAQACRALGKVGVPEDATILSRVMMVDTLEDCRIAAIEGLGELKTKDPRVLQLLISGMEHDDPAIRLASLNALRSTTGTDHGIDPAVWRDTLLPGTQTQTQTASAPPSAPRR